MNASILLDGLEDPVPPVTSATLIPNVNAARGLALGMLLGALVWAVLAAATYLTLVP